MKQGKYRNNRTETLTNVSRETFSSSGVVQIDSRSHLVVVTDRNEFPQQPALFPADIDSAPSGFRYQAGFLSSEEETALVRWIETLPLKPFEFRGYLGNRRVMSFGFRYDYSRRAVDTASPVPGQLAPVIERGALWSGHKPGDFRQVLVTEYAPGAPIGWHADKPQFGDVLGISLLAPAPFRLRRPANGRWERKTITLEPRSIYLMSGEVRKSWQHSIPPLTALRYSITLRTLADNFVRRLDEQQSAA
jgi:alkylated DNA repair dioxygenase AlkB